MIKKIIKILLIDDDEFIRMLIKDIFWVHGKGRCQIYAVSSIKEGEEILKKENIDLIFLDLFFKKDNILSVKEALIF
jgi:CheY-like chemotaxis protein